MGDPLDKRESTPGLGRRVAQLSVCVAQIPKQVAGVATGLLSDSWRLLSVARLKLGTDQLDAQTYRDDGAEAAIILIHGFGSCDRTWGRMPALLLEETALTGWDVFSLGYDTGFAVDVRGLWSADPDIATLSTYVSSRLRLAPFDQYRALALVAHSMGGLVVQRALLDDPELVARTSHVLLYGTPSGGLRKAQLGSFLKVQIRDMAIGSAFLDDLRSRWSARFGAETPFRFWTVAGDRDVFVPAASSLGPFPIGTRVVVPGNHLEICTPERPADMAIRVLVNALAGGRPGGPLNAARVAVEGRQFRRAADLLLPRAAELDDHHLVELALALEATGRRDEAIGVLRSFASSPDALGTLAGRLKRVWMAEGLRREAEDALGLYSEGFEAALRAGDHAEAAYHAVNVAFLQLSYRHDPAAAMTAARDALDHCASLPVDRWRVATEGEAHLYLGDRDTALECYGRVLEMEPSPRELGSMYAQAGWVAVELGDPALAAELDNLFSPGQRGHRQSSTKA